MTSSSKPRAARPAGLPPALSSMWRLCKLGYSHEPGLLLAAFTLSLLSALPDALLALWFKLLGDGVLQGNWRLVRIAAVALGVSATATWFLRTVSTRVQRRFRDKVTIALESHVARLLASIATIAHQERPEYLDRLAVLRNQVFMLDHMYMSLFSTCGWILRLGVTVALLMSIHPALALLAVFAAADRADVDVAACGRTQRLRAGRAGESAGSPSVRHRDDRDAGQGSPRDRHRRSPDHGAPSRLGVLAPADRSCALALGGVAHAGLVGLRRRLRGRHRVRLVRAPMRRPATFCSRSRPGRGCLHTSAERWGRLASCAVLDGQLETSGVARRLRRIARVACRPAGAGATRRKASASSTCRLPIPAPSVWCSTT